MENKLCFELCLGNAQCLTAFENGLRFLWFCYVLLSLLKLILKEKKNSPLIHISFPSQAINLVYLGFICTLVNDILCIFDKHYIISLALKINTISL